MKLFSDNDDLYLVDLRVPWIVTPQQTGSLAALRVWAPLAAELKVVEDGPEVLARVVDPVGLADGDSGVVKVGDTVVESINRGDGGVLDKS